MMVDWIDWNRIGNVILLVGIIAINLYFLLLIAELVRDSIKGKIKKKPKGLNTNKL